MEAYENGMLKELEELTERRKKLFDFISGNPLFYSQTEDEQNDMREQWMHMKGYEAALKRRCIRAGLIKNEKVQ